MRNLRKLVLAFFAVCFSCALTLGVAAATRAYADTTEASDAFKGVQINLNESITVKYELEVPADYTAANMTFTVGENGAPITAAPQTGLTGGSKILFTLEEIAPNNMADSITATVTFTGENKDEITQEYKTSIKEYCQTLLKNAAAGKADGIDSQKKFEALKTLVSSLLTYGDEAQKYTGKEASSTTGLTVAQKNAALKATADKSELNLDGTAAAGLDWTGVTLLFGNKVDLVYYFTATEAVSENKTLGVKVGDIFFEAVKDETVEDGTGYKAVYTGLSVTQFDEVITASVATKDGNTVTTIGQTLSYSVKTYAYRKANSEKMSALSSAVYSYGVAVKAYTEALVKTESVSSLGEMLEEGYNVSYETERVVDYGTKLGSWQVAHTAYDGKYLYALAGSSGNNEVVSRINIDDYTKEATSATIGNINEQNVAMFVKDSTIYIWTTSGFKTLPTNFTADTEVGSATLTFGSLTTYQGIGYDETRGFVVLSDNKIYYFDKDYNQIGDAVSISASQTGYDRNGNETTNTGKRLYADANHVYINYWANKTITPSLLILDWNGGVVGKQVVTVPSSVHGKANDSHNIQSVLVVENSLYFTVLSWEWPSDSALFKTTFTKNLNLPVGEYYEENKTIGYTDGMIKKLSGNGVSGDVRGFVVKDGYGYVSSTSKVSETNTLAVTVTKFKLATGETVGYQSVDVGALGNTWDIGHDLFIYNDEIYLACIQNKKLYKAALGGFTTDGGTLTEVTGFFGGATTYAEAVACDEVNDRFAVRVGSNLYVGKNNSLVKVATTASGKLTGMYTDGSYIYILSESNGSSEEATAKMQIFDWNGNEITNGWNTDIKPMNGAKNNNVRGMSVVNGKVYFLVLQYGGSDGNNSSYYYSGAYIASGYFA